MIVLDTIEEESAPGSSEERTVLPSSLLERTLLSELFVDKVFESSDSKTSSLDRETLDGSLSTFESLDTERFDESAEFSSGTDTSDVSSTKLVVYESVTLTSLAEIALTDKAIVNNIKKVNNSFLFKIIYLHNNFFKHIGFLDYPCNIYLFQISYINLFIYYIQLNNFNF